MNIYSLRPALLKLETMVDEDSSQLTILYGIFKVLLVIAYTLLYQAEEKS